MNFNIETANHNDFEQIIEVLKPWNMHHIPSVEMEMIDFKTFFVAKMDNKIVGVSGYKILSTDKAKTTLLAVYPEFKGSGIGKALQERRLEAMYKAGVKKVSTNADRSDIILWYKKHYGYREIGRLKKIDSFGLDESEYWTTLEMDLDNYFSQKKSKDVKKQTYILNNDPHPLSPYPPLIIKELHIV